MTLKNQTNFSASRIWLFFFIILKVILSFALVNGVYELHRDEFLHLDQGKHLAAGFTSVPPLTSLFSWLIRLLGNGFFVVRLCPAILGAVTIFFCWQIVDLLKGRLKAKCLVAVACLCSSLLMLNTLYQPNSFDVLAWTAVFYFLLKYFEQNKPANLYYLSVTVGLGFLNKYNILFLLMGLLLAVVCTKERKILKDKHFYGAVLLCLLLISPNVIWQINHHFPVIKHMKELQSRQLVNVSRIDFFTDQLLFFINSIFVLLAGIGSLFFFNPFKKYRWVLLTYLFTILIFGYLRAKNYYALGLYPVLLSFGAVYLVQALERKRALLWGLFAFIIAGFIYILPLVMPVYSPEQIIVHKKRFEHVGRLRWEDGKNHDLPQDYADMQGWKEIAALTDLAYERVPDKSALLVRADNYGLAGAVNYYSKFKNINAVSYEADYLYWFKMDKPVKYLILIRDVYDRDPERKQERPYFNSIVKIGSVTNKNSREFGASVFLLGGIKADVNEIIKTEIKAEKQGYE